MLIYSAIFTSRYPYYEYTYTTLNSSAYAKLQAIPYRPRFFRPSTGAGLLL